MSQRIRIVVTNMNAIIPDLHDAFDVFGSVDIQIVDALLVAQDIMGKHLNDCITARRYGIPSFVVQHGRSAAGDYFLRGKKPVGDYFLAWGENDVRDAIAGGWDKDKVFRIGSPCFIDKVKATPDGKTVVFVPVHAEASNETNDINAKEGMNIWGELKNIDGVKSIAKLLTDEHNPSWYSGEQFFTKRKQERHIKKVYEELLYKTSCVVSQREGTFELLAYSMDIPVVRIRDRRVAVPFSASEVVDSFDEIEGAVKYAIAHPEKNRDKRKEAILQLGGIAGDDPKGSIVRIVEEVVNANKG